MISVIIPCRNDATTLGEVLAALHTQTYPPEKVEIIVVDNGSSDASRDIGLKHDVIVLDEATPSAYLARNRAIAQARGDFLLFLDADTIPCEAWIAEMLQAESSGETGMAGGRIENRIDRETLGSALLALTHDPEKRRASVERDGRLSGGNMIVRRALFDRFGLFLALQSGADGEFSTRANPAGKPMPYAEKAMVQHVCDISTMDYLKRAYREARGQAMAAPGRHQAIRSPLPWRPGFRRALEMKQALKDACGSRLGPALLPRVFLVLWLERWFFFCGAFSGRMSK